MSNAATGTRIEADPKVPTIRIVRDFASTPAKVCLAHTDAALAARWMGPRNLAMEVHEWDAVTGGHYRYSAVREGQVIGSFFGSFHEVRPGERLVQTFTWDGAPDGVTLETVTFTDLGDGHTRVESLAVVSSFQARDSILASGMDTGVIEGYEKLDELLATL